jgi:hypothetical protein
MQPVTVDVEELPVPGDRRDRQALERGDRRIVGLEHGEPGDVDLGHHAADTALFEEVGQGLDLGELRHLLSLADSWEAGCSAGGASGHLGDSTRPGSSARAEKTRFARVAAADPNASPLAVHSRIQRRQTSCELCHAGR